MILQNLIRAVEPSKRRRKSSTRRQRRLRVEGLENRLLLTVITSASDLSPGTTLLDFESLPVSPLPNPTTIDTVQRMDSPPGA